METNDSKQMETNDSKVAEEDEILRIAELYKGHLSNNRGLYEIRRMAIDIKRKRSKEEAVG